jgi:hypothetical protein
MGAEHIPRLLQSAFAMKVYIEIGDKRRKEIWILDSLRDAVGI